MYIYVYIDDIGMCYNYFLLSVYKLSTVQIDNLWLLVFLMSLYFILYMFNLI
jgi:hypothetical protein